MYVSVDDVDTHYARATAAGADVEGEPVDQPYGVRSYGALDPEGHQWWFVKPL
ncbi:MAG: VOC family protein [Acidimicrobiia bacterium]